LLSTVLDEFIKEIKILEFFNILSLSNDFDLPFAMPSAN